MRVYDSSITRVVPTLDYVGSDIGKLVKIMRLFNGKIDYEAIAHENILESKYGNRIKGNPGEKQIPPVRQLLKWFLINSIKLNQEYNETRPHNKSYHLRKQLFEGDKKTLDLALNLLSDNYPIQKVWYVFEGYTCPDIYIETKNYIFIGEAKRTENKITSSTVWYKTRDQLIRHVDSVIDKNKKVLSFYIFDRGVFNNANYLRYLKQYEDINFFQQSLPHRNDCDILKIMKSYIGYIFWDELSELFSINYPNKVNL